VVVVVVVVVVVLLVLVLVVLIGVPLLGGYLIPEDGQDPAIGASATGIKFIRAFKL
jgi:hypothetical protein